MQLGVIQKRREENRLAKVLELAFENAGGKVVRISLDNPVEPVNAQTVNHAMDTILAQNAFTSSGGDFIKKNSARIVERNITDIPLA